MPEKKGNLNIGGEKYRPQFHFTPRAQWMNDPNGLVYYQGEYHLFYQHNPDGTEWGPMHWGHAVSTDLLHWEHLAIALRPNQDGMIFSGSVVVDWQDTSGFFDGGDGLVAIFTHFDTCPATNKERQRQSLAYSFDKGRTWHFYQDNPVLVDKTRKDFRDPKVIWHSPSNKWVMVLATGRSVQFFGSPNLKDWKFLSEFTGGSTDGVWECPDFFPLPVRDSNQEKWVLEVDVQQGAPAGGSGAMYFIGNFDGTDFSSDHGVDETRWLDYGKDYYAGVSWSDVPSEDGRRIFLAWMNNWQYANDLPTYPWRGTMTIPRTLSLERYSDGLYLQQSPVRELNTLRMPEITYPSQTIDGEVTLEPRLPRLMDMELEVTLETASEFGLRIVTEAGRETVVGYDISGESLYVDRTRCGEVDFSDHFPGIHQAPLRAENGKVTLRVLVDSSSIEVFANGGRVTITDLIFPEPNEPRLVLFTRCGKAQVNRLVVYPLTSIFAKQP